MIDMPAHITAFLILIFLPMLLGVWIARRTIARGRPAKSREALRGGR